jgi:hypothetical protein
MSDLIARLRAPVPTVYDCKDAADALEAQARRIAELEALYDKLHVEWWEVLNARIAELTAALKPFADAWDNRYKHARHNLIRDENLRAARAAYLGEKE